MPELDWTQEEDIDSLSTTEDWPCLDRLTGTFAPPVVGWSVGDRLDEGLTLSALGQPQDNHQPKRALIHYSDCDSHNCGYAYRALLAGAAPVASMSCKDDPWDTAKAESWMQTIKAKLGGPFSSLHRRRQELVDCLEDSYKARCQYSSVGNQPPAEMEPTAIRQQESCDAEPGDPRRLTA